MTSFSFVHDVYIYYTQFIIKIVYSSVVDIKNYYYSQVLSSIIFQTSSGENDCKKILKEKKSDKRELRG